MTYLHARSTYGHMNEAGLCNHVRIDHLRIAVTSAETSARFVRERVDLAPLTWLTTPKRLLCGRTPLDACRTPEGFRRIAALHALSLGLDAAPICVEGFDQTMFVDESEHLREGWASSSQSDAEAPALLFTATIVHEDERAVIYVYAAMIAKSATEVRRRLRARVGGFLEDVAVVKLGFDCSEPIACAMVSAAMADVLTLADEDPNSSIALGLDFQVEQRFAC